MRVTANTFPNALLNQLSSLSQRQNKLQNQAATGQIVSLPEDDPVAMRRILDMQAENGAMAQYQRNISRHQELGTATYDALRALKSLSDKAGEIAIAAGDLNAANLPIYAKQITELIKQAVQIANTKNRGDYVFSGTNLDQTPFVLTTDVNGVVTAVAYQGNTTVAESEIGSGITLTTQVPGQNNSGTGVRGLLADDRVGADFINHLIALQNHLLSGDVDSIETNDRAALGRDEDNFLYHVGHNGALQSRLEASVTLTSQRMDTLEKLVSKEADADLTETIVRLTQTQTAYQAALQSAGRILGSSLLDYLR
jgi:flagellar hook-associated protein 3 FlgL